MMTLWSDLPVQGFSIPYAKHIEFLLYQAKNHYLWTHIRTILVQYTLFLEFNWSGIHIEIGQFQLLTYKKFNNVRKRTLSRVFLDDFIHITKCTRNQYFVLNISPFYHLTSIFLISIHCWQAHLETKKQAWAHLALSKLFFSSNKLC